MTRGELAAACTVLGRRTERGDIARYEEGTYCPRLPTFAALARVFGVSRTEAARAALAARTAHATRTRLPSYPSCGGQ